MNVFVTGIAGFIGSTVAAHLEAEGHSVWGVDDLSAGRVENVPTTVPWHRGDLMDLDRVWWEDSDVVVHLAAMSCARWPDAQEVWRRNLLTTAHVKEVFDGRMIFSSTCVANDPLLGAYAGSKWACEQILPDATIFRFANVYGPRARDWGPEPNVMAAWQRAIRDGEPIRIDGDGSQTRDFIHVDDVARAVCLAVENPAGDGKIMDVCTGVQTSVIDLADRFDAERVFAERHPADPDSMPQDPRPAAETLGFFSEVQL